MLVKQEQITPCEVELHIEVEAEKLEAATNATYAELAKSTNVPGFRKGKAPRKLLEQFLDKERVMERVADKVMETAYPEALEESKLKPFAAASVELVKMEPGEPMQFKAKVPLAPTVELGEYTGLTAERKAVKIEDEQVDAEINNMLMRQAEYSDVTDRPLKSGDTALIEMKSETEPDEEPKRNVVQVGENLPDFDKGLEGMQIGEEKVIDVSYPDEHPSEELKGKTVPIRAKLIEIHERKLPELNDEWVVKNFVREPEVTEGEEKPEESPEDAAKKIDTVAKLRAMIREAMEKSAIEGAEAEVRNNIIEQAVKNSTVCFPDVMVEDAVHDRMETLQESLKKRKVSIEDYLAYMNQTPQQLYERFAEESKIALATTLVFREIMEKEGIEVADEDYQQAIEEMAAEQGVPAVSMQAYVDSTDMSETVKNRVLRKKIVDFVVQASNIKNAGATGAKSEGKKAAKPKAAK